MVRINFKFFIFFLFLFYMFFAKTYVLHAMTDQTTKAINRINVFLGNDANKQKIQEYLQKNINQNVDIIDHQDKNFIENDDETLDPQLLGFYYNENLTKFNNGTSFNNLYLFWSAEDNEIHNTEESRFLSIEDILESEKKIFKKNAHQKHIKILQKQNGAKNKAFIKKILKKISHQFGFIFKNIMNNFLMELLIEKVLDFIENTILIHLDSAILSSIDDLLINLEEQKAEISIFLDQIVTMVPVFQPIKKLFMIFVNLSDSIENHLNQDIASSLPLIKKIFSENYILGLEELFINLPKKWFNSFCHALNIFVDNMLIF